MDNQERKITLVTAYFDIGRGKLEYQKRTNTDYVRYFEFWARMQNELIVYTTSEYADKIIEVRKKFGLANKTRVIIEDNIWEKEPELLEQMNKIEKNGVFKEIRINREDISNQAEYDYIMLMKYWCLQDSVKKGYAFGTIAWFDFGFNHAGRVYSNPNDFDFEWKYSFENKIYLFVRKNPMIEFGIVKLMAMSDSVMGPLIICPDNMCMKLYEMCKESMWSLITLDCLDDDQMLLRMAYRKYSSDFIVKKSNWFLPLKEYGGEKLRLNTELAKERKRGLLNKIKAFIYPRKLILLYSIYKLISKENT